MIFCFALLALFAASSASAINIADTTVIVPIVGGLAAAAAFVIAKAIT